MAEAKAVNQTSRPRRWYRASLTTQILIGLVFGGVLGYISPKWGNNVYFLRDIFLNLIKSIIAPLIFSTLVVGIAGGDVLQIVAFSVLFAMAVSAMGEKAAPILRGCEALSQVMFKFTNYVMMFAPIGVGAAMAHTIATNGLSVLVNLGKLIGSLYLALAILLVFVFGSVMPIARVPIKQFLRAVREPFTIAFATTSSESALPKAMENMERLGVPRRIVGFVMPTGYSFNLDGTTLYLAMASVFVAQAAEPVIGHMSFGRQIVMMLTLMITSKGVAGVPR